VPASAPDGEPVPPTGRLPESAYAGLGTGPFSVYVHVPFCASRCGYCDFNTYTARELPGVSTQTYVDTAIAELRLARRVLGGADLPVSTVFFGGGTPTLLPPGDLLRVLSVIDAEFGLAPNTEVTVEANPESVDAAALAELRAGGVNRMSLGMQSARPHVLAVLDRVHTPGRARQAVAEAHTAGFRHVNLDVIYGTPGESDADWTASLRAAIDSGVDHVSAYALIVEDGTRLAARIRRGELAAPDDDVLADRYEIADELLGTAGLDWYEVSNWAASPAARCRHNLAYWRSTDWWGIGPGAHSHVSGTRWWNVRHPSDYAARLADGHSPAAAREILSADQARTERILLEIRLRDGCPLVRLSARGRAAAADAVRRELLDGAAHAEGRAVLTRRGRLLADAVVRDLVD
jgi:oxygen-independent coproporphyrinogen-3 oxidase